MIEAELFDGTVLEFPDGTNPEVIQNTVKRETAAKRGAMPSKGIAGDVEVLGTGVRQGIQSLIGIPHAVSQEQAGYTANDYDLTKYGYSPELDAEMRKRRAQSGLRIQSAGEAGMEQFPSAQDVSRFVTEKTGLVEVQPQNTRQRIIQAAGQGVGAGGVFGPVGAVGGAIGGTAAQSAEEAGAPPWLQMALGVGLPAITGRFGAPKPVAPTTAQLKTAADAAYEASRNAGLVISQPSVSRLIKDISDEAIVEGIDRVIHPKATSALNSLEDFEGAQATLRQIDTLRQRLKDVAASPDAAERRLASIMIDKVDEFLEGLKPADVVAGDADAGVAALKQARELWARMRKSWTLENAITTAEHRVQATGSGGNINNAIRQNIRTILDNPKKARGFTAEERKLMEQVVNGTPVQNLMRLIGKLSPEGNGLMMALGVGGTMFNPTVGGVVMTGMAAKRLADNATRRNADKLMEAVQSGRVNPGSLSPTMQQILRAFIRAGGGAMSQVPEQTLPDTIRQDWLQQQGTQ